MFDMRTPLTYGVPIFRWEGILSFLSSSIASVSKCYGRFLISIRTLINETNISPANKYRPLSPRRTVLLVGTTPRLRIAGRPNAPGTFPGSLSLTLEGQERISAKLNLPRRVFRRRIICR